MTVGPEAAKAALRKMYWAEIWRMSWNSAGEQSWDGEGSARGEGAVQPLWREEHGICKCRSSYRGRLIDTEARVIGSGQSILDMVGYVKSCEQRLYVKKKKKEMEGKLKMIKNKIWGSEDSQWCITKSKKWLNNSMDYTVRLCYWKNLSLLELRLDIFRFEEMQPGINNFWCFLETEFWAKWTSNLTQWNTMCVFTKGPSAFTAMKTI